MTTEDEKVFSCLLKERTARELLKLLGGFHANQLDASLARLSGEHRVTYLDKPHPELKGVKVRWWRRNGE
jgi:hypothetical protein